MKYAYESSWKLQDLSHFFLDFLSLC